MRILWIKMGGLWPPTSGGRIRSLETIAGLSRRHEVTVLTTHGADDDPGGLSRKLPHCRQIVSVPFVAPRMGSRGFAATVARSWLSPLPLDLWKWRVSEIRDRAQAILSSGGADLCVADFLVAIPNVPGVRTVRVPIVLFEHNVEYVIWKRLAALETRPLHKAALEIEWRKVRRFERAACLNADLTVAVSEEDCRGLHALAPMARVTATPTGVDTEFFKPGHLPEAPHSLVFTGSMDWYPNEDAILHFGEHILPLIRARVPDVSVTVVGRNPGAALQAAAPKMGITLTGTVDDVRPYVDRASVYIVPLRAGGGTRLKIFEALAMGKAVVSTPVGAEGLALTHDHDVVIADRPNEFAQSVVRLFEDPFRREAIGRAGRQLVESRYSWERVTAVFEHYCQSALEQFGRAPLPESARVACSHVTP